MKCKIGPNFSPSISLIESTLNAIGLRNNDFSGISHSVSINSLPAFFNLAICVLSLSN